MRYELTVEMDNDAFQDAPGEELARILENIAARLRLRGLQGAQGPLYDVNGNRVGTHYTDEAE